MGLARSMARLAPDLVRRLKQAVNDGMDASLAEGLRLHVADVQRRLPTTTLVLQLDEPSLPAVLAAHVPTSSGFRTLRAPDVQRARDLLRTVLARLTEAAQELAQ
jgi:hypothetical protein